MAQNDALSYLGHAHRLGWVGGWHREGGESVGHIPAKKNAPTFNLFGSSCLRVFVPSLSWQRASLS